MAQRVKYSISAGPRSSGLGNVGLALEPLLQQCCRQQRQKPSAVEAGVSPAVAIVLNRMLVFAVQLLPLTAGLEVECFGIIAPDA